MLLWSSLVVFSRNDGIRYHTVTHTVSQCLVLPLSPSRGLSARIAIHWLPQEMIPMRFCLCIVSDSSYSHPHTLLITSTWCYDEIKGTQDQDLFSCSFSDSLSPSHLIVTHTITSPLTFDPCYNCQSVHIHQSSKLSSLLKYTCLFVV